jgi:uncharacterized membrane protein YkoI
MMINEDMRSYTQSIMRLLVSAALGATMLQAAPAPPDDDAARVRAAVAHGEVLPLPQILSLAQHRVRGEILKVELEEAEHLLVYEVKMLTPDGRVRELKIDARAGRVLKVQDD